MEPYCKPTQVYIIVNEIIISKELGKLDKNYMSCDCLPKTQLIAD